MFRFENLEIWNLAIDYCDKIFNFADTLPNEVKYTLGSQIRDAVLSISNNIAEGSGSNSKKEFQNFLNYSIRSLHEVVSMLVVSKRRAYLSEAKYQSLYDDGELLVKKIQSFKKTLTV